MNDPSNPAIGGADPETALATDQQGLLRDNAPDLGAFEAGGSDGPADSFPDLAEKQPLARSEINGADPSRFLIGDDGDATITFLDEYAGFQSVLGVYLIDENGGIHDPAIVFDLVEHAETSSLDGVSRSARPGGGPLHEGDSVSLSDLYDPSDLAANTSFGLFVIADGRTRNADQLFEEGRFEFRDGDDPATLFSTTPELYHIADNGKETRVRGDIAHSADGTPDTPLENSLNMLGQGRVVSGVIEGDQYIVGFEDKVYSNGGEGPGRSGGDFNDLILAIDAPDARSPIVAMEEIIA